jgi:hypothetical protein
MSGGLIARGNALDTGTLEGFGEDGGCGNSPPRRRLGWVFHREEATKRTGGVD